MFLYPALTIGFLFVAVPLLVHLINMLRHRRQRWAAMDFLLASYRKQKKWIRLRQLLLLLSRLAVAALLIAMLCGWTGGNQMLGLMGGQTVHHVVILDDSYSMGDVSAMAGLRRSGESSSAYQRSLQALEDLTKRLAGEDGNHQLTVMRASRAALSLRGGSDSGDASADLSAQTITPDARLINRVIATTASPIRTDLVPALDLAAELIESTPADSKFLYIASDFRARDWDSPERLVESLRKVSADVQVRMIDCAAKAAPNLAITSLQPAQDVWVAGVPVVVNVTVHNYGTTAVQNVSLAGRVIRYPQALQLADPTVQFSGNIEALPAMMIESIPAGGELTKSFQVFVTEQGTHAIEVSLPDDALGIDNTRTCTLPLSDVEKVLVVDSHPDSRGAYHIASVLNPGSQVRIGAIPEIKTPGFLRTLTLENISQYRAVYLVDVPEIGDNAARVLEEYVQLGGGLAWFLGAEVQRDSYNQQLLGNDRHLLPGLLEPAVELETVQGQSTPDFALGDESSLTDPLRGAGDAAYALVALLESWNLASTPPDADSGEDSIRVRTVLKRRDGLPIVTSHRLGEGNVVTVLTGLDGRWTNWPGDPTFVVFLLQANAMLWSGAAPPTSRFVDDALSRLLPESEYAANASYVPASRQPPRVPLDLESRSVEGGGQPVSQVGFDPKEKVISGDDNVDELLRPGISEWVLTKADGRGQVLPVASVLRPGEGDLARADANAIQQALFPMEVKFVSSGAWSEENRAAGSSTMTLLLLGLLGLILAAEQSLAYWASYHVKPNVQPTRGGGIR